MRPSILALVLALSPRPAVGQAVFRFRPEPGAQLRFVSETHLSTVVVGFPSLPDSTVIESSWRTVATQRVIEARGTDRVISEAFDSSRARVRIGDGPRTDIVIPGVEGLVSRWLVNDRLDARVQAGGRGGDSAFVDALGATEGGFAFDFPPEGVQVGREWTTAFRFPLGAHLAATAKIAAYGSISGRATATLDSLVARGVDTLAYLSLRALADPNPLPLMAEDGTGTGMFSGGFAASLVWSTGWNAVVSAGTNGRVVGTVKVNRREGPPVNGALSITISAKQQVRP